MPKVSIIVPNYNHAPFLNQRLDSIFNQTFQDFEVILLDDASKDNSVSILEDYKKQYDSKVSHLVVNEKNSGSPFKQWKKGIELARGEYVWIAESDDWAEESFLEKTINALNNNPKIEVAFTNSKIHNNITGISLMFNLKQNSQDSYLISGSELINSWVLKKGEIRIGNVSCTLFQKNLAVEIFEKFPDLVNFKYAGDKYFWTILAGYSDFICVNIPLNNFRKHQGSTVAKMRKKKEDSYRDVCENLEILSFLDKNSSNVLNNSDITETKKLYLKKWRNRSENYYDKWRYIRLIFTFSS